MRAEGIDIDTTAPTETRLHGETLWAAAINDIREYALTNVFSKLGMLPV